MSAFLRNVLILLFLSQVLFAQKPINLDSLKTSFEKAKENDSKAEIALEIVKHFNGINPDSAAKYVAVAKKYAELSKNKKLRARSFQAEANLLQNTGRFNESALANEHAINLFESIKDIDGLASSYSSLGLLFKKNSGDEFEVNEFSKKALAYEQKALKYYLQGSDTEGLLKVYSNLGIIYRDLKDFLSAEKMFLKGIETAEKRNYKGINVGVLKAGYSQVFLDYYKDNAKAISLLDEAIEIYLRNGVRTSLEHAYRNKSYNYTAMGQYAKAITFGNMAVEIADEVKDPHRQIMAYSSLHHAQKMSGMYKESMMNLEHVNDIEHILLSKEKAAIIAEMNTKYETVKKDAAIQVLTKDKELSKWKIWGLIAGLIILSVLLFAIFEKRKKDAQIREQEKAIEKSKLEQAEIALESKKKELTSKVLQLAQKNEFLAGLGSELESLRSNVDSTVNKTSNSISKKIRRDIANDNQWEQFSTEFSSVHKGFLDSVIKKHGNFSKTEIRLISLLKMNLSSKEIADVLGISQEGIKKARYRLRIKMNLEDSQLQAYLLTFS